MDFLFQIKSLEDFQNVAQEILSNLYCSSQKLQPNEVGVENINLAKKELIAIMSDCNFDTTTMEEHFSNKKWPEDKVRLFLALLKTNKSEVLVAAFNHYNSNYCETVVNFNWCAKMVLGTSDLKTLKTPLLQLTLSTLNKNGKINKSVYEVDKDMLLKMINSLENVK
ncbi:unnamed protein product [Chrysodeixis includens]|uniref:COMM domain-containing protein n=1 Tax=Chrysodeixis includens TaxID=689277 RepID=A0A9P0BNH3_CHRIL|nr:unnamed protein product [Chrysodeixis includens]